MNETIKRSAHGHSVFKSLAPVREWAEIYVVVEPCKEPANEIIERFTRLCDIPAAFRPDIHEGVRDALATGIDSPHPVLGVRVLLVDGAQHHEYSTHTAFRRAACEAVRDALRKGGPHLCEFPPPERRKAPPHAPHAHGSQAHAHTPPHPHHPHHAHPPPQNAAPPPRATDPPPPPPPPPVNFSSDSFHCEVLGLVPPVNAAIVRDRWRELVKLYHPDRVQHLGPKLKLVAEQEMKLINEAYRYFQSKFGA